MAPFWTHTARIVTALERAFCLATSGTCATIGGIKAALKAEGYPLEQVTGSALGKQLKVLIEPRRVCRRLQILRDWSHGESQDVPEVLSGGA